MWVKYQTPSPGTFMCTPVYNDHRSDQCKQLDPEKNEMTQPCYYGLRDGKP